MKCISELQHSIQWFVDTKSWLPLNTSYKRDRSIGTCGIPKY